MRSRPLQAAVVAAFLAAAGLAVAGIGMAATPATAHGVVVTGQVTGTDGEPVAGAAVLVQPAGADILENATDGERVVRESLRKLANAPPVGLRVNRSDADGRFVVHLPYRGDYEVLAVSDEGVSRLHAVTARNLETTRNLTVDPARIQRVRAGDAAVTAGERATVRVRLENTDDEPVRNLTVDLGPLPPGWTVAGVETAAAYDADARRLRWDRVPAGETATATVRIAVPDDAGDGTRTVDVTARSDDHFVEHVDAIRVRVGPPGATITPETTPTSDGLVGPQTGTPGGDGFDPLLAGGLGVFLVGLAVSGYAVWRTGVAGSR